MKTVPNPIVNFNADQILFDHVWKTLPDSIAARKQVLTALQCKLTARHPAWKSVGAMMTALDAIEELQSQLPFSSGGSK